MSTRARSAVEQQVKRGLAAPRPRWHTRLESIKQLLSEFSQALLFGSRQTARFDLNGNVALRVLVPDVEERNNCEFERING